MEIEDRGFSEHENTKMMKTIESSKEIQETMNLKTRMSENPGAV